MSDFGLSVQAREWDGGSNRGNGVCIGMEASTRQAG